MFALSDAETELLRDSLRAVRPFAQEFGALFFLRLCELEPSMRARLPDTLGEQSARVFAVLEELIGCLGTPDRLAALALKFAAANRRLGLGAAQHAAMRQALLWAVERSAAGGLSGPTRATWARLLSQVEALVAGPEAGVVAA